MGKGDRNRKNKTTSAAASGYLMQLHYMAAANESQGIPTALAPTGPETDETRAQREHVSDLLARAHVATADWTPTITDEMSRIRPSDAMSVVEAITDVAREWWDSSGYTATWDQHQQHISAQLDGLVPPERRQHVQHLLDVIAAADGEVDVVRARHMLMGAADRYPFEAIHVAAALGVALWSTPACVPDPTAAQLALARILARHLAGNPD